MTVPASLREFVPEQTPLRLLIARAIPDMHVLSAQEVMWILKINGNHLFRLLSLGDLVADVLEWPHRADDADYEDRWVEGIKFFTACAEQPLLTGRALRESLPRVEQRFVEWYGLNDYLWRF